MRHAFPEFDPGRWREIALAMPAGAAYVALAAVAHWLEQTVPLSPAAQAAYWTLAAVLAARYLLWARTPLNSPLSVDLPFLLVGAAAATGIAWLQRSLPTLFFYLIAIEGAVVFVAALPRWLWIAGVAALSLLVGAVHLTLSGALVPWLHALPVYLIIGVATELLHLGDRQRVTVERLAEELTLVNRQLQDYMAKAEALAVAEERARMAREMHDTLGHDLTKLDVQLELAARLPADRAADRETILQEAVTLVKSALRNLRAAVHALREDQEWGFALPQALTALAEDFQRQSALPVTCHFAVSADAPPLPPPVALCLYRTAQEGLTNVVKHARASEASVLLEVDPHGAMLTVSDNGQGNTGETGFGLRGLTERSKKLGGTLTVGTKAQGGFELKVSLPC